MVTVALTRSNAEIYNIQSNQHFNSVRMSFSSIGNDFHKNLPFHTQQIYTTTYHHAELLCHVAWSVQKIKAALIIQVLIERMRRLYRKCCLCLPFPCLFPRKCRASAFLTDVKLVSTVVSSTAYPYVKKLEKKQSIMALRS